MMSVNGIYIENMGVQHSFENNETVTFFFLKTSSYSCNLSTANIEYSCPSVCVSVCVSVYTTTKDRSINLKLAVYHETTLKFFHLPQYKLSSPRPISQLWHNVIVM